MSECAGERTVDAFRSIAESGAPGEDEGCGAVREATAGPAVLDGWTGGGARVLLVVAAPLEYRAIAHGLASRAGVAAPGLDGPVSAGVLQIGNRFDVVVTGVGKANAAIGVTRALAARSYGAVVNIGVGGALRAGIAVGTGIVVADAVSFGDEGVATPAGFEDIAAIGFGPGAGLGDAWEGVRASTDGALTDALARIPGAVRGGFATVSACSGTDEGAAGVAARTGAAVEDMESAAAALAVRRVAPGTPFTAARSISNTTGSEQAWALDGAVATLRVIAASV